MSKITPKAIILAGGFGKRLGIISDPELVRHPFPKPTLQVGPQRIIDFSLNSIKDLGLKEASLATYHLKESLEYLAKNRSQEMKISLECVYEEEKRDTAGACKFIVQKNQWNRENNQILILSADIIQNLDLRPFVEQHLLKEAALSIVVYPEKWTDMARFGSVRLEGMPKREDYKTDENFFEAVTEWVSKNRGKYLKVEEFREKLPSKLDEFMEIVHKRQKDFKDLSKREQEDIKRIKDIYANVEKKHKYDKKSKRGSEIRKDIRKFYLALSNLNNASIYLTSSYFWINFMPFITFKEDPKPFSDWGSHVFPAMAGDMRRLSLHENSKELQEKIKQGKLPFYAYIMPEKNSFKRDIYFRDAGTPKALLDVNNDVLRGMIYVGLKRRGFQEIKNKTWVGWNTYISQYANIPPLESWILEQKEESKLSEINSIISHDVVILDGATIHRSTIGSYVFIDEGALISGSLIMSPHFNKPSRKVRIGKRVKLTNCIVVGADIPDDSRYENVVIAESVNGGLITEPIR